MASTLTTLHKCTANVSFDIKGNINISTIKRLYQLRLDKRQPMENQPGDAFYRQLMVDFCSKLHFCSPAIAIKCCFATVDDNTESNTEY